MSSANTTFQVELETTKARLQSTTGMLDDERRRHAGELADVKRQLSDEVYSAKRETEDELRRQSRNHAEEVGELERRLKHEMDDAQTLRARELQELKTESSLEKQRLETELNSKLQQVRSVDAELEQAQEDLKQEKVLSQNLRSHIAELSAHNVSLESSIRGLKARIDFLESDCKSQSQSFVDMEQRLQDANAAADEAKEKLRVEETLRRKLHNQVQELKGNIRVFCRVRPSLDSEPCNEAAKIAYPDLERDSREVEVQGPEEKSSLGVVTTKRNAFAFDRVFGPSSHNQDVFEEISQLVQSALDGYNVCIFCYGQTGSGTALATTRWIDAAANTSPQARPSP